MCAVLGQSCSTGVDWNRTMGLAVFLINFLALGVSAMRLLVMVFLCTLAYTWVDKKVGCSSHRLWPQKIKNDITLLRIQEKCPRLAHYKCNLGIYIFILILKCWFWAPVATVQLVFLTTSAWRPCQPPWFCKPIPYGDKSLHMQFYLRGSMHDQYWTALKTPTGRYLNLLSKGNDIFTSFHRCMGNL